MFRMILILHSMVHKIIKYRYEFRLYTNKIIQIYEVLTILIYSCYIKIFIVLALYVYIALIG